VSAPALVLGAGGLGGLAWEVGLLAGLAAEGVDVTTAGLVVGTSAGATVGAQLTGGIPVAELYRRQLDPASPERRVAVDHEALRPHLAALAEEVRAGAARDERRQRAAVGAAALAAATPPEAERRAIIAARLSRPGAGSSTVDWPAVPLLITAVDAGTGEFVVFHRDCGVDLVDAVAASGAVPTGWPPVTIGARRYVDGGVRSATNADLAAGHDPVVVLAPDPTPRLAAELAALGTGTATLTIFPDAAARAAMGTDLLDPACRPASARAGREQATRVLDRIRPLWTDGGPVGGPVDGPVGGPDGGPDGGPLGG
jgi:NTE family protein